MSAVPPDNAVTHVRNLLQTFEQPWEERAKGIVLDPADVVAIVARLRAIQRQLEFYETVTHFIRVDGQESTASPLTYAEYLARGIAASHDTIQLRAVGDHVERVYPEAASAADESDA